MKTYYYNVDDREFTLASGDRMRVVPELFYQEHAVWRLCLRDRKDQPIDISGVTAWQCAVDNNYCSGSAPMCRVLADGIIADAESGAVEISLDATADEFLAAVNGATVKPAYFELVGFNSQGERSLYVSFEIAARMTLDPDPTAHGEIPEALATKTQVSAIAGAAVSAASEALQTQLNGVSGGLQQRPTSGGAEQIASTVARNMLSGGGYAKDSETLPKDKQFSTTVGGYTLTYTSNGGLTVTCHDYDENAGVDTIQSAVFAGGNITLVGSNDGNMEHYRIATGDGALVMEYGNDSPDSQSLVVGIGGITANGSAITQGTVEFAGTSLGIDTLEGGVKYICQSALTALSIGSAAPGCNATIFFTVANGAIITPPSNVRRYGVTTYTPGSSYVMAVNGDMAVVVEEDAGGVR